MSGNPSPSNAPPAGPPVGKISLRIWGILLLVMFLLTSAVGGSLALESSYLVVTLASHIGLALTTLALGAYGAAVLARPYGPRPKAFVGLAALSALGGTLAGTVFLLFGQNPVALYAMEGFAGLGILSALLLMVFGGPSGLRATTSNPA